MLLGPVISAAFAGNPSTTWRWSFYIVIPFIAGLVFPLSVFALPHPQGSDNNSRKPLGKTLAAIDWIGVLLLAASIVLWDFMTLSCGTLWPWNAGNSIATCAITCLVIVALISQQVFSLFTTSENRLLPVDLLTNRTVLLVCISTCMMSTTYSIALYCEAVL
jgi:MFS family permease